MERKDRRDAKRLHEWCGLVHGMAASAASGKWMGRVVAHPRFLIRTFAVAVCHHGHRHVGEEAPRPCARRSVRCHGRRQRMNMALRMPLELREEEHIPLRDFQRAMGKPVQHKGRIAMALIVLGAHAALIAAIIWAGTKVYSIVVPPQPIEVAVLAEPPKAEIPPPPPPPKMMTPEVPIAVAPEITIATPPPAAIAVQQVKNPAPAAPASPTGGTGKDVYLSKIITHLDPPSATPHRP